jgi:soluble lytic murein transglycosylase-like protein
MPRPALASRLPDQDGGVVVGARADHKSWRWALGCLALGLATSAAADPVADGSAAAPVATPVPVPTPTPSGAELSAEWPRPPMHDYAQVQTVAPLPTVPTLPTLPTLPALHVLPAIDTDKPAASAPSASPAATEPEPALTVDAGGLPRISGFQHNAPKTIVDLVEAMAPTYQLAPELVLAFMQAESSYNPNALSPKNARGLMQLIPGTAERFNVRKPFDPKQNIRGGQRRRACRPPSARRCAWWAGPRPRVRFGLPCRRCPRRCPGACRCQSG